MGLNRGLRLVAHQLPPMWDGRDVEWRAWMPTVDVFACPPQPREPCVQCKSTKAPMINIGIVHPAKAPGTVNLRPSLAQITAFRCPECHLDTIWDRDTDDWWTLDPSDYGPDGSTDPRLPIAPAVSISCREMWFRHGEWSAMLRGSLRPNGQVIITDRSIALYVCELDGCTDMPAPEQMTSDQIRTLSWMLVTPWLDEEPTREFDTRYLDLLEFAGYVIRPLGARTTRRKLVGYRHAHAIVNPAGRVAGVLMPLSTEGEPAALGATRHPRA